MSERPDSLTLPLNSEDLRRLQQAGRVEDLFLAGVWNRDQARRLVAAGIQVKSLEIRQASPAALNELLALRGLQFLRVHYLKGRGRISSRAGLESLVIGIYDGKNADADLAAISRWKNLKRLSYRCAPIGPQGLASLAKLMKLEWLDLEDCEFDDAMVPVLVKACPSLRRLILANTRLSRVGLRALVKGLPALQALDIWGTKVRCRDLPLLASLQDLRELSIGPGRQRFPGFALLPRLRELRSLQEVELDRIPLSLEDLREIQSFVPKGQWSDEERRIDWP